MTREMEPANLGMLEAAIDANDFAMVEEALAKGVDPHGKMPGTGASYVSKGLDAYEYAVTLGRVEILDRLLAHQPRELDALACLGLRAGTSETETTPLAALEPLLRCLQAHGFALDEPFPAAGIGGMYKLALPLSAAIEIDAQHGGDRTAALLKVGANPGRYVQGHWGALSPIKEAIRQRHLPGIAALVEAGLPQRMQTSDKNEPLIPLLMACRIFSDDGCRQAVSIMLDAGFDPNILDGKDMPAVFNLLHNGECTADVLQQLLQGGLNPDTRRPTDGWTLLHFAAAYDDVEKLRLLIAHGADVQAFADGTWYTPLCRTEFSDGNGLRLNAAFEILIDAGADLWAPIHEYSTVRNIFEGDASARIIAMETEARQTLWRQLDDGSFIRQLETDGKPSPWLLRICALGLLAEIAQPELWGDTSDAMPCWRRMHALLPPYWRTKMDAIDMTAFVQMEPQEAEMPTFVARVATLPKGHVR